MRFFIKFVSKLYILSFTFLKTLFIFRGRGREGERKRNIDIRKKHESVASCVFPRNQAHNLDMCPDQESNQ